MRTRETTDYLLRAVPTTLWLRVKARAAGEGRTVRAVVLRLLERYVREGRRGRKAP